MLYIYTVHQCSHTDFPKNEKASFDESLKLMKSKYQQNDNEL